MRLICLLLLVPALMMAQTNALTQAELADGWILLFDGESAFGWSEEGDAKWTIANGALVSDPSNAGWLRSNSSFADYVLKLEFRTGEQGNSGVFLRSAAEGLPHETGYELQIWDQHPEFATGSLVNHVAAAKTSHQAGEWNSFVIRVQGDRWIVNLNGKQILDATESKSMVGHIGLQCNAEKKIEFRNIKLKPLGLQPIFDGRTLAGWKNVERPKPAEQPPVWSVQGGAIHVEKGPGQLETTDKWADFVLQLDIKTNPAEAGMHPNSGVFFRGTAGVFWSGYESQIRNEYDGVPTVPVDFGTGGIYRNQPARKVVAKDGEYFSKTIVARGRHMAVWINGYPVSDFEDTKPLGTNVRNKEAVVEAGVISLQAHDPTTNLDFRNLRFAVLPKE
jgi:3-keto-disaccharide hydrolase